MAANEIAACQHADCGVERVRIGSEQSRQVRLNLHPVTQSLENLRPLLLVASPWPDRSKTLGRHGAESRNGQMQLVGR
jgi:hypothetical protein